MNQLLIFGNKASAGPLGIDQSAAFQFGKRFLHCVRVDGGLLREIADGRKLIARLIAPGDDVHLYPLDDLQIDRPRGIKIPWHMAFTPFVLLY